MPIRIVRLDGGRVGYRMVVRTGLIVGAILAAPANACVEVIAHRGASGYLPEHTLPAYALAYGQGAHWIEPDVVLTADEVPVALHDVTLGRTTDVAEVFPDRARDDGEHYVADFTYAETSRLRVVDAIPGRYPHATFRVPALADVLELVAGLNRTTGRRVGVYPELKQPASQPKLAARVLATLAAHDLPVLLQSFDQEALAALETDYPRIQLIDWGDPVTDEVLNEVAGYAIGVGLAKSLVAEDASVVRRAKARGLAVHVYTLRADRVPARFASFAEELSALEGVGVDAVFTDHPDRVLAVVEGCEL